MVRMKLSFSLHAERLKALNSWLLKEWGGGVGIFNARKSSSTLFPLLF